LLLATASASGLGASVSIGSTIRVDGGSLQSK
jgi:hypothetical protein